MQLQFRHRLKRLGKLLTQCDGMPDPNSELGIYLEYKTANTRGDRKRAALRLMRFFYF